MHSDALYTPKDIARARMRGATWPEIGTALGIPARRASAVGRAFAARVTAGSDTGRDWREFRWFALAEQCQRIDRMRKIDIDTARWELKRLPTQYANGVHVATLR